MNGKNVGLGASARMSRTVLRTLCLTILVAAIMLGSSLAGATGSLSPTRSAVAPTTAHLAIASGTANAYTYPTTTMQEPNYTGGEYRIGSYTDVEHLNIYSYTDLYSGMLLDELYDTADNYAVNQTYIPWAASGWVEAPAAAGTTVYDPLTASMQSVAYTYDVTLRPGIQWSDYTSANAGSTYVYSNHIAFSLYNRTTQAPEQYSYTYPWAPVTMNTETMQSADLILSWEILESSADYASNWANVVDVRPVTNLTAEFYLSAQSATFVTTTLGSPILPYHVWQPHDCADLNSAAWNYTGSSCLGGSGGYDSWNVGYNTGTGTSNQLVGSGPFLFTNYAGQPQGKWIPGQYWELTVNPYYFVQYVPTLRQYTPRIAEIYSPLYGTESAAIAALSLGQIDTITNGVDSTFIPTLKTITGTSVFYQPAGAFGYIQFNSNDNNAPFNITAFRQALNYATNKAYLASVVDQGFTDLGQPTVPIADSVWHNYSTPQYSYDTAQALSLIGSIPGMTKDASGDWVYRGTPVTANVQITVASEDPLAVEGTLLVAQEWSSVGVPTTVTQEAFSTLVSNLIGVTYNTITLGVTGIQGDPTAWFFDAYNQSVGVGTGFYEGPFSSLTVNGKLLSGTQVDSLMNNLTNECNTVTNFTQRLAIAYEIEGIAAQESTLINLGYPILVLPFSNNTFNGLIRDSLAYATFMYWNFLSFYEKTFVAPTPAVKIPTQLHVGVIPPASGNVFYNGQYGNLTIQVRNQYGEAMAGMNVSVGYNPTGALLNVTSDSGLTNAQGEYVWEFQVLGSNPLVYTSDYSGEINVSVAATAPTGTAGTFVPGLGWTYIDVAPEPVAYKVVTAPVTLVNGASPVPVSIEVYNPTTGNPIAGYSYTLEALTGAVVLTSALAGQSVSTTTSFSSILGFGFASVMVGNTSDYQLTEVTGVTGASGLMNVDLAANASVNWTAMGQEFPSWLFIGSYAAGAPLVGASPYSLIAQITSAADSTSFGADEPVEIPLVVANTTPTVDLSLTVTPSVSATASGTVTVTATNATSHMPMAGYEVTLTSQNAEGANRGILAAASGTPVEASTPNSYFGSAFIPGLELTTNASGVAVATFSPGLYTPSTAGGVFVGFTAQPFTDAYLVPFDEFEVSAWGGATSDVAAATIVSPGTSTPAAPTTVVATYLAGSSSVDGIVVVPGNASYPLYVNSTIDSPWGPATGAVPVNLSTTLGTLGSASGTTSSSGSYSTTYTAPTVSILTEVQLGVKVGGSTTSTTQTVYLLPASVSTTTTPGKTVTTTTTNMTEVDELAAVAAVLGLLVIVFAALWLSNRQKQPPKMTEWTDEDDKAGSMSGGGSKGTGGAGGAAPPPS